MNLNQDSWIVEAILDLEQTMASRQYISSAKGLARVRLQLIKEICDDPDAVNIGENSNVVRLFV